jgi:hypothetical protein
MFGHTIWVLVCSKMINHGLNLLLIFFSPNVYSKQLLFRVYIVLGTFDSATRISYHKYFVDSATVRHRHSALHCTAQGVEGIRVMLLESALFLNFLNNTFLCHCTRTIDTRFWLSHIAHTRRSKLHSKPFYKDLKLSYYRQQTYQKYEYCP